MATTPEKKRRLKTDHGGTISHLQIPDKKKSKLTSAETKSNDLSLFMFEENELDKREPGADLDRFKTACNVIRQNITEIKESKKSGSDANLDAKRIDTSIQFIDLKKLNRIAHLRCKKVRDGTNEAKQTLDQYHLQLQNLLYEAMHLQKEITKCVEFKSKDEEIELVPVDKFYENAPPDISKPKLTKGDSHEQMLARLDWELEQRQELYVKLKNAENNKDSLVQEIKTKQEYLDSLQPKLSTILESTKPVQEHLDMPFDKKREQKLTACHLPHPLYIVFMQTSAYRDACDKKIEVAIIGDLDEAKSFEMTDLNFEQEEDSDSEPEEQEKHKKSRRRKKNVVDKKAEQKKQVLKKHPLRITVDIRCQDDNILSLTFNYLVALHIITVDVSIKAKGDIPNSLSGSDTMNPGSILDELYPGDNAQTTPNPANKYLLKRFGMEEFSDVLPLIGLPYMWVQWMGGLNFNVDHSDQVKVKSDVSIHHMTNTMKLLRQRVNARFALIKQLASLDTGHVPVTADNQKLFPTKVISHLQSWKRSTYEDFMKLQLSNELKESGIVDDNNFFFTCIMERQSAKMVVQVAVSPNYPKSIPYFSVKIDNSKHLIDSSMIKEIEAEVNVFYEELMGDKKCRPSILSNQIQRLLVCFDVFVESGAPESSGITKDKVFVRKQMCPTRSRPFQFQSKLGIYMHR